MMAIRRTNLVAQERVVIRRIIRVGFLVIFMGLAGLKTAAASPSFVLRLRVVARTHLRLTDIVWTGHQFLYVENTTNHVYASAPDGTQLGLFAQMPREVEETRCAIAPGGHGFPAGYIYCHSPTNQIYRISPDGRHVRLFTTLPHSLRSDGALAFDSVGRFDFSLLAATGRSGNAQPRGGTVFRITSSGKVQQVGTYSEPGGADEIAVAPAGFGAAGGDALLTVDAGSSGGKLVAMDNRGHTRVIMQSPDGLNPIVVISGGTAPPESRRITGYYVTDTNSGNVYFSPASNFHSVQGDVLVGSEVRAFFWMVRPAGSGFSSDRISTTLPAKQYNLEAATYIGD